MSWFQRVFRATSPRSRVTLEVTWSSMSYLLHRWSHQCLLRRRGQATTHTGSSLLIIIITMATSINNNSSSSSCGVWARYSVVLLVSTSFMTDRWFAWQWDCGWLASLIHVYCPVPTDLGLPQKGWKMLHVIHESETGSVCEHRLYHGF